MYNQTVRWEEQTFLKWSRHDGPELSHHMDKTFRHGWPETAVSLNMTIGLYREIAIAIQKESGDSNGGNV